MVSFDDNEEDWNEFALYIGMASWEHDVYFFKNNKVIAFQQINNKYGVEINHYKDQEGKTVIYYLENFASGTGIWQYNYFFYRYNESKLEPILNVLQNSNMNEFSHKILWFETTVEATNPLILKFVYSVDIHDVKGNKTSLIADSSTVVYKWNSEKQKLIGAFPSNFNEDKVLAFGLMNSDAFLIRIFKDQIQKLLEKDESSKDAVFYYLNVIKNQEKN